jgi:hypothetical protein
MIQLSSPSVVADHEPGRLVLVLHVLRTTADRCIVADTVVFADRGVTFDHAVRTDRGPCADRHMCADDGIRSDFDGFVDLCARFDDRSGMNPAHASSLLILLRCLDGRSRSSQRSG